MPDILVTCPITGRPVPTGIGTESIVLDSLPKVSIPMHCPECGGYHYWTREHAWVDGEEPSKVVPVMDARRRGRHRLQRL